jgi:putative glycosyltransferase (TIGR04372 family)
MIFGVPIAHTNMIPVDTLGFRFCDLSIPKLVWSKDLGRYLNFKELFSSEAGSYIVSQQYKNANLRLDENSSEDIHLLVIEMLARLEGGLVASEDDQKRHEFFLSLFKPGHYSYQSCSRVGLAFLQKYQDLL